MLPYAVVTPVLIASFLFVFSSNKIARVLAIAVQSLFVVFAFVLLMLSRETDLITVIGSYTGFTAIALHATNICAVFILLTSIIFLAVAIYSIHEENSRTFWFLLFILEATLVGLFLTRDLFNIFVMVEVGTVVIAILTMYYRGRRQMFAGMAYLMLNVVAMLFYLFGLAYLYMLAGAFDISYIAPVLQATDPADKALPYALMMTGIAFKCSIIPMFSFVPKVRLYPGAPSAVVAILSGVQIKTNIFIFMQMQEVFGDFAATDFFLYMGIIVSLMAVFMAICQTEIKMILAYHTISQVGLIVIGLSAGSDYSFYGGLFHIVSHGVFKSALFLSAGIIYHSYGTMDVYKIRGVFRRMPLVGAATAAAVLGITGAPFFIGSISKYFITTDAPNLVVWAVRIISLGTIISFIKYSGMFFGKSDLRGKMAKADKWLTAPCLSLGLICLFGGVFGGQIVRFLFVNEAHINWAGYAEKAAVFFISAAIGFLIYKTIVSGNYILKKVGRLDLSFQSVCVSYGGFFALLLVAVGIL